MRNKSALPKSNNYDILNKTNAKFGHHFFSKIRYPEKFQNPESSSIKNVWDQV